MDLHICNKDCTQQLSSGNLGLYIGHTSHATSRSCEDIDGCPNSQSCIDNSRGIADCQWQLGRCPNSQSCIDNQREIAGHQWQLGWCFCSSCRDVCNCLVNLHILELSQSLSRRTGCYCWTYQVDTVMDWIT